MTAAAPVTLSYGDDAKQRVDVYAPAASAAARGAPIAVFLHGGVWQHGDRAQFAQLGRDLAAHGFVAFIASYRLTSNGAQRWPAQIEDAAAIVALALREGSKHGGDPAKLVIIGHSAGAQMAALLQLEPTWLAKQGRATADIRALALFSGVFDLALPLDESATDGGFASFVRPVFGDDAAALAAASPLRSRARFDVPLLLVTSANDYGAMRAQSFTMAKHLRDRKERVTLIELPGVDHFGMVASLDDATAKALHALLER